MRLGNLSIQDVPELRLPMGYFRFAPWVGVLAAGFLLYVGNLLWYSRWTNQALGATHFLVLGCIVPVVMGAMLNVLPVISSATVPWSKRSAPWIQGFLTAGAVSLAFGIYLQKHALYLVAAGCLPIAFGLFLGPVIWALARRVGGGDSLIAIRIAVLCLLVTVGLGFWLLTGYIWSERLGIVRPLTSLHFAFGLGGWITLTIIAVSFQVLPMFHVAPDYPRWITLGLPVAIPIAL